MYIRNILWVTKKPPKILIAASTIAKKPKIFEISKLELFPPAKDAMIARAKAKGIKLKGLMPTKKPSAGPSTDEPSGP